MRLLYRLLMTLMIAVFAAQPVMACCLTGHQSAQATVEHAEPPCHDAVNEGTTDSSDNKGNASAPSGCPGCVDCDMLMLAAPAPDNLGLVTANVFDDPGLIAAEARSEEFEPRLLVLSTGPPRNFSPPLYTPISLKQRLQI